MERGNEAGKWYVGGPGLSYGDKGNKGAVMSAALLSWEADGKVVFTRGKWERASIAAR
jgi:hypothetical protein